MALLFLAGCAGKIPEGSLVVTQTPANMAPSAPQNILDERYPAGSRVVLVSMAAKPGSERVLSTGLAAAGSPVIPPSGTTCYFVGKATPGAPWQIYQVELSGGRPKPVTSIQGGAMDPAILPTGELVFSSPVPNLGQTWTMSPPPALYVQGLQGAPRRISFGPTAAIEPTVLADGRVLFVSARKLTNGAPDIALFTANDDGTEVTAFALNSDGNRYVHRPRELLDGRIGFLATASEPVAGNLIAEGVRNARPFLSRSNLFSFATSHCRSVEADGAGGLLACLETRGMAGHYGVYQIQPDAKAAGEPLYDDPGWNEVEAVPAIARPNPMGHVSAMMKEKDHATILCMDVNYTRHEAPKTTARAERLNILTRSAQGSITSLGEVPVQRDGSFMAEVPMDVPLGFETLDAAGNVLHRSEPFFWARPGENRACIGCHEPYNRTMRNFRPIAAGLPPAKLQKSGPGVSPQKVAHGGQAAQLHPKP